GVNPTYLWDTKTGKELGQFKAGGDPSDATVFSGDGRGLAIEIIPHPIRVWDIESGKMLFEKSGAFHSLLDLSPDSSVLAARTFGRPVAPQAPGLNPPRVRNLVIGKSNLPRDSDAVLLEVATGKELRLLL